MSLSVCAVPVACLRAHPAHPSEMVSQLLFGETAMILEGPTDGWVKIKCQFDGYEGYCQQNQLLTFHGKMGEGQGRKLAAGWTNHLEFEGLAMHIPFGSQLTGIDNGSLTWGGKKINFLGNVWDATTHSGDVSKVKGLALQYLNTSYLWGGRSVFGADCSGLTQTIFKFININLPRDSSQQFTKGSPVATLGESSIGDLAFFDDTNGKIVHVGILLGDDTIIHSSGIVRIDRIEEEGILHPETSSISHHLCGIRRYV